MNETATPTEQPVRPEFLPIVLKTASFFATFFDWSPEVRQHWMTNEKTLGGCVTIMQMILRAAQMSPEWAEAYLRAVEHEHEGASTAECCDLAARSLLEHLRIEYSEPVGVGDAS